MELPEREPAPSDPDHEARIVTLETQVQGLQIGFQSLSQQLTEETSD